MPNYNLRNRKTGKIKTEFMTITEMLAYEKEHPDIEVMCGAPGINDEWRAGIRKPSSAFRDKMKEIKKHHPLGNVNTYD